MPDPYAAHEEDEDRLRALLYGADAGILWQLGRLPERLEINGRRVSTAGLIRRRPARIALSSWWRAIWEPLGDETGRILARVTRIAARPLIVQYASRLGSPLQANFAERFARDYASALADSLEADTRAGMIRSAASLRRERIAARDLAREIGARMGPTPGQLTGRRGILTWETRVRREGILSDAAIRRELLQRIESAAQARADAMASDAIVSAVTEVDTRVYAAAGTLIYSWNPLDDRTHPKDRRQTIITRARPTPAGKPWTDAAPYRGMMPYHARCRCRQRPAGS